MKKRPRTMPSVRIIGGNWRGRVLKYSGDPRTRPMKDRTREAIFNLLGPSPRGKLTIDFFAGTGALALESLSRGAERAICVERHFPSGRLIEENAEMLGAGDLVQVATTDAFLWAKRSMASNALLQSSSTSPWLLFFSPPYDFFVEREAEMLELIDSSLRRAPAESILVVESDSRFDSQALPLGAVGEMSAAPIEWDVRHYHPAQVAILELPSKDENGHSQHS